MDTTVLDLGLCYPTHDAKARHGIHFGGWVSKKQKTKATAGPLTRLARAPNFAQDDIPLSVRSG
jgi:hypothetical protein